MSYNHYCYQTEQGFQTCDVDEDVPPEDFIARWGVSMAVSAQIDEGADVRVGEDGKLIVVPNPSPPPTAEELNASIGVVG